LKRYEDGQAFPAKPPGELPTEQRGGANAQSGGKAQSDGIALSGGNGSKSGEPVISIRHAREHNLQGIDVVIPREKFTVITGVSGSGKSTVAFDILFAEGQRRYLESLNAYARQFVQPASRPDVDGVYGVPPTVAIEQRTSRGGRKSTVGTLTEIYHFLRLLLVRLGTQYCPECQEPIQPQSPDAILSQIRKKFRDGEILLLAPLVVGRKGYYTDLAKWASGKGFSHLRVDGKMLPTDPWPRLDRFREHDIELPVARLSLPSSSTASLRRGIDSALSLGKGMLYVAEERSGERGIFSAERACPRCRRSFEELDPRLFSFNSKQGWCSRCYGTGVVLPGFDASQTGEESEWTAENHEAEKICPACGGHRLRPEALNVRFQGKNIADLSALPIEAAEEYFRKITLQGRERQIARDLLNELRSRFSFLKQVGLSYLSLDRGAPTLSGGEAQRIRLAAQLGSNLRGVCYILDEPTIGLHARDNERLLRTLHQLKRKGNTVVVVEHDEATIRQAEHIVDLGPGGGVNGGKLVDTGTVSDLIKNRRSLTGRFLAQPLPHPLIEKRRSVPPGETDGRNGHLMIAGVSLHNLKDLELRIPLRRLICVTGVSGSGKSSLVQEVIYENLSRLLRRSRSRPVGRSSQRSGRPGRRFSGKPDRTSRAGVELRGCREIFGWEEVDRVLEVDQAPIGKTPRSCPATYVGFWSAIRELFAQIPDARIRGYQAARFSFNVAGGRCEACAGQGLKKIEMSFLPDVRVVCDVCEGRRFNTETREIRFRGKSIADVLAMSVDEAAEFFSFHPAVHHALTLLQDVGLGYLLLGQQSPTLSGGEAQRIKLVSELSKSRGSSANGTGKHTVYVLDEPTIGLHMADVEKLIRVLHRLVDAGNTVIIIEHNLDVVAEADWIVDLGPEGGQRGGRLVAQGSPEEVIRIKKGSHTAKILADFFSERSSRRHGSSP
jgi:excinuclease ABC subunit A